MEITEQQTANGTNNQNYTKNSKRNHSKKIIIGVIGTLLTAGILILLTLSYLSQKSIPGQTLYGFKTNVAEKVILTTKLSTHSRVSYDTSLFEKRLQELAIIANDHSTTSPELIAQIATLTQQHAQDAISTLEKNQTLDGETRITLLATIDTAARAIETLSDSFIELENINDAAGTTEDAINLTLNSSIDTFVTNNATDTIQSFIAANIADVGTHLSEVAPGSRAQNLVARRISDANEAIVDSKYADAITAIIRARQAIAVDGYLFDSERGPVDGVELEAGPVPEGN